MPSPSTSPCWTAWAVTSSTWAGREKAASPKLVTQHMGYTNFIAAAEGLLIAARAGLDLNVLAEIVPVSAGASRAFDHFPRAVFDGQFASAGTLDIVAKDLHLACELAREVGAPSPVGNIADDVFKACPGPRGWGSGAFLPLCECWSRWPEPKFAAVATQRRMTVMAKKNGAAKSSSTRDGVSLAGRFLSTTTSITRSRSSSSPAPGSLSVMSRNSQPRRLFHLLHG